MKTFAPNVSAKRYVLLGISYEHALYFTKIQEGLRHETLEKYFVSYIILLS